MYPGFFKTIIGTEQKAALSAQRLPLFLSSSHSPLLRLTPRRHRRYQDEIKMALQQNRVLLACALLFVPPVVPICCDVKAAIQSREKGDRGLSSHQSP